MLALIRAVFGTWTKNTSLAKVYVFPTTLWMKSVCRVSIFHLDLFFWAPSQLLHSYPQVWTSSLARAPQGALATHPVPWSLWSLSKKEKMVPAGGLFFTLSGFLLPLSWNRYLQSKCSYRTKFSRCLCSKFRTLRSCELTGTAHLLQKLCFR